MITANSVLELFEGHPERLTNNWFAKKHDGSFCKSTDPEAVQWCVIGACTKIGVSDLSLYNDQLIRDSDGIVNFIATHTFDEVLDLLRRAGV